MMIFLPMDQLFNLYKHFLQFVLPLFYFYFQNENNLAFSRNTIPYKIYIYQILLSCASCILLGFVSNTLIDILPYFLIGVISPVSKLLGNKYIVVEFLSIYTLFCYIVLQFFCSLFFNISKILSFFFVKETFMSVDFHRQFFNFWLASLICNIFYYMKQAMDGNDLQLDRMSFLFMCIIECCNTYLGLLSMSVSMSYISRCIQTILIYYIFRNKIEVTSKFYRVLEVIVIYLVCINEDILQMYKSVNSDVLNKTRVIFLFVATLFLMTTYKICNSIILNTPLDATSATRTSKHIRVFALYITFLVLFLCVLNLIVYFVPDTDTSLLIFFIAVLSLLHISYYIVLYIIFMYVTAQSTMVIYLQLTYLVLGILGSVTIAHIGVWIFETQKTTWILSCLIISILIY